MNTDGCLTAREAAAYCRTTYRGFDAWVRRHGIKAMRYGRHRRFTKEQLDLVMKRMAIRSKVI